MSAGGGNRPGTRGAGEGDVRVFPHARAEAMAAEIAHHRKALALGVALDGVADVAQLGARVGAVVVVGLAADQMIVEQGFQAGQVAEASETFNIATI